MILNEFSEFFLDQSADYAHFIIAFYATKFAIMPFGLKLRCNTLMLTTWFIF